MSQTPLKANVNIGKPQTANDVIFDDLPPGKLSQKQTHVHHVFLPPDNLVVLLFSKIIIDTRVIKKTNTHTHTQRNKETNKKYGVKNENMELNMDIECIKEIRS